MISPYHKQAFLNQVFKAIAIAIAIASSENLSGSKPNINLTFHLASDQLFVEQLPIP